MAFTTPEYEGDLEKKGGVYEQKGDLHQIITTQDGEIAENADNLHRRLDNRQIQLIAIGGSIGTAVFVSIGSGLERGGPGSLFLAYLIYSCFMGLVNNCTAEMITLFPVSGGFVRLAGHFVDEAFGFMAGWNFFLYEALIIPFEVTALTTVIGFWSDNIPAYAIPIGCIVLYGLINILAVKAYGEAEFWLSGGKVILLFLLFMFTFVTMVGGNPQGDAYGFRYWNNPGAFEEHRTTGTLGRFEGFLACLWSASFTVVGPEYVSMVAAEAKRPRIYIKAAFKTAYWRFGLFFIGSALCVGIVCAYNDPVLVGIVTGEATGGGTATASPYVIAMRNLRINGLPHLVNALLCTSIFSAGNTYVYCATRTLYGLALEGRAPGVLKYCTKSGVPLFAFAVVMIFPCLSFLQLSNGSAKVLGWLINLVTAGGVINFISMCITYIFFYRAVMAQGVDRKSFPYCGWFQPYGAYIALAWLIMIVTCYGYSSFRPFSVENFFIYYALLILAPINYIGWKLIKRTKLIKPHEADLVWERPTIDAYEATFIDPPTGFWREMLALVGIGRKKHQDRRRSSVTEQPYRH
ncbi:General amino acid permease AGP2 [Fulvia fulva]|uniref:General amino acid permease AGP2 n=1 Tax=Passalora fulva TaxID=5499 RepID=A0A9Q8PMI8_PASFU|nr:General amino acid permease AGP2 [Fulvia fulva]KAK4609184.1 General amino acid permease AGP2 [Fulvia fulva]KAK4609995.1 General amino acid permease AGP2 [Fulvia fulva]UJO25203.1 General amino acid permease AGP2 [Fulvia fulva]WPV22728.1 General amino acid permease AGP2 [Fulvia fulva]WPV37549.1 General amino acid permease AGP2 [Fulvia fulva]